MRYFAIEYPTLYYGTIKYGKLESVDISDTTLYNCDFDDVSYEYGQIDELKLSRCTGRDWQLNNIELRNLRTYYLSARNARWERSDFYSGYFYYADLSGAEFSGCDFERSKLSGCDLSGVEISNCDIDGLRINGVDIEELLRRAGQ